MNRLGIVVQAGFCHAAVVRTMNYVMAPRTTRITPLEFRSPNIALYSPSKVPCPSTYRFLTIQSLEGNQAVLVNLKNGGLNARRHSNGQDTCFGHAIDLVGSHRG
jgi:hypothetical protein